MGNSLQVSVVVPTYNRAETLKECLEKLIRQKFVRSEYEIIIVDDGSTDNTKQVVEEFALKSPVSIRYFYQKNQGQGVARNYGVRNAKGKIIIFIGDDILVVNDFIKQHALFHRKHIKPNDAVLGFVGWDPRLDITPFMEWLVNGSSVLGRFGGHQFAFEKLKGKDKADYNFFYTSNISLKRPILMKHPFDTRFSSYGWEDIELGYRLHKKEGLNIRYNPFAVGYHCHEIDEEDFKNRMRQIGKSAHLIHKKYPELKKVPSFLKKMIFIVISNNLTLYLLKKFYDIFGAECYTLYFYALSKKYFLQGLKQKS